MQVFVVPDSSTWTTFLVRGLLCFFVHVFALFLFLCSVLKINIRELIKDPFTLYKVQDFVVFARCGMYYCDMWSDRGDVSKQ